MPWSSIAAIGSIAGPIIGGLFGMEASSNAADAQIQSGNASNATQLQMYNQNRADMAPWREAGVNALTQLRSGTAAGGQFMKPFSMADFQADPGYGFRLAEGLKALDKSAAARGNLLSGGTLKGITRYGQDAASQEYGNAYNRYNQDQSNQFNRLASLSGLGQTTAQQIGVIGTNVANSIGQTQQGMGNARASGYIGSANALAGGLAGASNAYTSQGYLNALTQNRNSGYRPYEVGTDYGNTESYYGWG